MRASGAEIWRVVARPGEARHLHNYHLVGRLRPGVSLEQAQRDVDGISRTLERDYPDSNTGKGLRLTSLQQYIGGDVRAGILMPAAATACLLLIACANVAGLMLARGQRRMGEVAMRAALGASRMRLVRQQLTESVVLTLPAGALGVAVAYLLQGLLFHLLPVEALSNARPTVDGLLLMFALGMSIVTGLLVGAVPAIRGTGASLSPHIGTGRQAGERRQGARLRGALVVAQIAVSAVLLVGAGLVARSLARLTAVDFGFTSDRLFVARVDIQAPAYPDRARRQAFYSAVLDEVAALPGVTSVGATTQLPILDPGNTWRIRTPDQPAGSDRDMEPVRLRRVSPGYFATMGMRLLVGARHLGRRPGHHAGRRRRQRVAGPEALPGPGPDWALRSPAGQHQPTAEGDPVRDRGRGAQRTAGESARRGRPGPLPLDLPGQPQESAPGGADHPAIRRPWQRRSGESSHATIATRS